MQDICLLVDARMILKWAVHSVNVTAAKVQKRGQVNIWDPCSKFSRSTYPEILIFCVTKMALEVSVPDSGITTFWIIFFSTCVLFNYTGKQLVS